MMKGANRVFVLIHLQDGREYLGKPPLWVTTK
jgi:hypothetical protein